MLLRYFSFLFLLFIAQAPNAQVLFTINDFKVSEEALNLRGNSRIEGQKLRLTPSVSGQRGACWYNEPISLQYGFQTEFTFFISENFPKGKGGDGFTFILQFSQEKPLGSSGDALGYKEIPNAVVFEFDTHVDADDKTQNQVALMEYLPTKKAYWRKATVHEIIELNDGKEHFARIEYVDGWLTFYLDSYLFPVLSTRLDIAGVLSSEKAWMGFTSATGVAHSNHDILSWSFQENPPPPDINTKQIEVNNAETVTVKSRKLTISVYDHNKIDGDIVSIQANDKWLLTNFPLTAKPKPVEYTFTGFKTEIILFANNLGEIEPNTATIIIDDGISNQKVRLESNMRASEAVTILYEGE